MKYFIDTQWMKDWVKDWMDSRGKIGERREGRVH